MQLCPLCSVNNIETDAQRSTQMCDACADKLGVIPMPPPLRGPHPCARCHGRKFTRIIPREHSVREGTTFQSSSPMLATYAPTTGGSIYKWLEKLDPKNGFGLFEIYACWGCGAVEWFCRDVAQIPIHPHLMTELVDFGGDGPYR